MYMITHPEQCGHKKAARMLKGGFVDTHLPHAQIEPFNNRMLSPNLHKITGWACAHIIPLVRIERPHSKGMDSVYVRDIFSKQHDYPKIDVTKWIDGSITRGFLRIYQLKLSAQLELLRLQAACVVLD